MRNMLLYYCIIIIYYNCLLLFTPFASEFCGTVHYWGHRWSFTFSEVHNIWSSPVTSWAVKYEALRSMWCWVFGSIFFQTDRNQTSLISHPCCASCRQLWRRWTTSTCLEPKEDLDLWFTLWLMTSNTARYPTSFLCVSHLCLEMLEGILAFSSPAVHPHLHVTQSFHVQRGGCRRLGDHLLSGLCCGRHEHREHDKGGDHLQTAGAEITDQKCGTCVCSLLFVCCRFGTGSRFCTLPVSCLRGTTEAPDVNPAGRLWAYWCRIGQSNQLSIFLYFLHLFRVDTAAAGSWETDTKHQKR